MIDERELLECSYASCFRLNRLGSGRHLNNPTATNRQNLKGLE